MADDILPILRRWPFEIGKLQARVLPGNDGRDTLQIRLDLGLLQLELDHRPDGLRPENADSLLDALELHAAANPALTLSDPQLGELMREGVQFYNRYMALFALGDFPRTIRDTERNLRLFRFVRAHAPTPADRWAFDQHRPSVTVMNARARGELALRDHNPHAALAAIDSALADIHAFYREYDREDDAADSPELNFLNSWRYELDRSPPLTGRHNLENQLALAIQREDYEEAARLRDLLRQLDPAPGGHNPLGFA